jgi:hypothetical protein
LMSIGKIILLLVCSCGALYNSMNVYPAYYITQHTAFLQSQEKDMGRDLW